MERLTKQRSVILEELKKVKTHPTASELYLAVRRRIPNISLGTVYRNLEILGEEGLIMKIGCDTFNRFDGETKAHQHFFCRNCQKVYDVEENIELKFNQKIFEEKTGHKIQDFNVGVYGICKDCRR